MENTATVDRNTRIDAARFVGFCAVVLLHVSSVDAGRIFGWLGVVNGATRFAVPMFFMMTGYLLANSSRSPWQIVSRYVRRLLPVFVFWELLYYLFDIFVSGLRGDSAPLVSPWQEALQIVFTGGLAFHLWYIPWLLVTVAIFAWLRAWLTPSLVFAVAAAAFLIGLAIGPYNIESGLLPYLSRMMDSPESFDARDTPFFGLLFMWFGSFVATAGAIRRSSCLLLGLIALFGFGLQFGESLLIVIRSADAGHLKSGSFDVLFGTAIYSGAVFLLLLRYFPLKLADRLAPLGRYALGMYCLHAFFILLVSQGDLKFLSINGMNVPERLGLAAAVIAVTTVSLLAIARIPGSRRFLR
ncbi:surface polysaccharide O-acyltransferase-like enzyme [Rhizobium aquaticum]|uniref:Surface polysaccharide O-acyltransferase-like enzyme n=1 Tax=Rhizobium aquaticum TaxID=1549636 RepID=A0ABV2IVS2_9HYPH